MLATTKAIGVASPKAQGQEIKSTAQACKKAVFKSVFAAQKTKTKKQKILYPYKVFRKFDLLNLPKDFWYFLLQKLDFWFVLKYYP